MALQAKPMLLMNMGQKHHIIALSLAHWTYPPSTEPTRRDLPDTAKKFHGPNFFAAVNEGEPRQAGTRLRTSLPFSISFIANIARKALELNRDNSMSL